MSKKSLDWKKYDELGKYPSISYVRESQDASSLACACCGDNQWLGPMVLDTSVKSGIMLVTKNDSGVTIGFEIIVLRKVY